MEAIIDRIEGDKAVVILKDGQQLIIPVSKLPPGAGEGAALTISFEADPSEEKRRRERIRKLQGE